MWDKITYLFWNLIGAAIDRISNFMPHFIINVVTYPPWDKDYSKLVKTKILCFFTVVSAKLPFAKSGSDWSIVTRFNDKWSHLMFMRFHCCGNRGRYVYVSPVSYGPVGPMHTCLCHGNSLFFIVIMCVLLNLHVNPTGSICVTNWKI